MKPEGSIRLGGFGAPLVSGLGCGSTIEAGLANARSARRNSPPRKQHDAIGNGPKSCAEGQTWQALRVSFEAATEPLPQALQAEGFGVITQIDLQQTFKAKLGVDFLRYRIFGGCNPAYALKAAELDPRAGLLLPCNVVLFERPDPARPHLMTQLGGRDLSGKAFTDECLDDCRARQRSDQGGIQLTTAEMPDISFKP